MKKSVILRGVWVCSSALAAVLLAACGGGGGNDTGVVSPAASGANNGAAQTTDPITVTEVATGLTNAWGLAFLPDGRMLVTLRAGTLLILSADGKTSSTVTGLPAVDANGQGGLLDVAADPAFATNRRIYLTYAERDGAGNNGTAVMRAELDAASRTLVNQSVIYQQKPKIAGSNAHFGSRLVFDITGNLWVTLGDRLIESQRGFAQDLARGNGKVVRITASGAPAAGNPVFGVAGAQPEIWSYGHRNAQGAARHPTTGELWTNEHGPQGGDEVNRTLPGSNYGWPLASYGQEYGPLTPVGSNAVAGTVQPATYWEKSDGSAWVAGSAKSSIAPSGMAFYTGDRIPEWKGNLFVGALAGTALWRLVLDGNTVTSRERLFASRGERIRDVRQGPDGFLYLLTDSASGKLLRLER